MDKIFNTNFEIGLRIILLLYVTKHAELTIDRIAAYDFITVYAKEFHIADANLHGDSPYKFSEFSAKRSMCSSVLKELVLDGTVTAHNSRIGFTYTLSTHGETLAKSLHSEYAAEYLETAKKTHQTFSSKSDASLIAEIHQLALLALRR